MQKDRALFLDRDGIVNIDHGYVGASKDFVFTDGLFPVLRKASWLGFRLILVTNQSGVARGFYDEAGFMALCRWMNETLAIEGIIFSGILFCPFHVEASLSPYRRDSLWRKPGPGMILQGAHLGGLDLAHSLMVGDQESDAEAAMAAGIGRAFLLASGCGGERSNILQLGHISELMAHLDR